jgi:hypothetical protein
MDCDMLSLKLSKAAAATTDAQTSAFTGESQMVKKAQCSRMFCMISHIMPKLYSLALKEIILKC